MRTVSSVCVKEQNKCFSLLPSLPTLNPMKFLEVILLNIQLQFLCQHSHFSINEPIQKDKSMKMKVFIYHNLTFFYSPLVLETLLLFLSFVCCRPSSPPPLCCSSSSTSTLTPSSPFLPPKSSPRLSPFAPATSPICRS